MTKQYVALVGMNTPTGRFEPGDVVTGLIPRSIPGLVESGALALAGAAGGPADPAAGSPVPEAGDEAAAAVPDALAGSTQEVG